MTTNSNQNTGGGTTGNITRGHILAIVMMTLVIGVAIFFGLDSIRSTRAAALPKVYGGQPLSLWRDPDTGCIYIAEGGYPKTVRYRSDGTPECPGNKN